MIGAVLFCGFALFLGMTASMDWRNRASLGVLLGAWVVLILVASGGL